MKEIRAIIEAYRQIDFSRTKASLVTVVRTEGSSYRRAGARMLVTDEGNFLGGISGGCLEGDALRRAQKAIASNAASVITYDTMQEDGQQIGVGLGCNGVIDVLFSPIDPKDEASTINRLSAMTKTRTPSVMVTVTSADPKWKSLGKSWLYENDQQFSQAFGIASIIEELLRDIHSCAAERVSKTISYPASEDDVRVFIEIIAPVTHLVLYAANNDMYPMVRLAKELGWDITVVTNAARADKSLFSSATRILHNKGEEQPLIDDYTAVLLMAHDYSTDYQNLRITLLTNASYIGVLGPRKRVLKMFDSLASEGKPVTDENLRRIFAPAGLDIGANAPEEIALSILAEIISHFTGKQGASLRLKEGAIHEN